MFKKLVNSFVGLAALSVIATAIPQWAGAAAEPEETIFTIMDTQDGVTWGLDRIDGISDGSYTYLSSGAGVRIYVVDTGVDATHPDFGSRVVDGFDAFGENLDQTDCQGHGTHVAGIAAGSYFGVAKSATIVPVRVLNCSGQGNTTTLTAGIDWILANHPAGSPAIVNMSLGGPKDDLVNAATSRLVSAGMLVTVAAGNSGVDACTFSPASANGVIAVGSISLGDTKSGFSNWGTCVDIFAPGSKISSDSPFNHSVSVQKSGTSQASPFVAGILATYISGGLASSPSSAEAKLYELSEVDAVIGGNSYRNSIANVEKAEMVPVTPTPEPVVDTPTVEEPVIIEPPVVDPIIEVPSYDISAVGVSVIDIAPRSAEFSWNSVPDATKYVVRVGEAGSSSYMYKKVVSTTEAITSNLSSNTKYWVVVDAYIKSSMLVSSTEVAFTTPYGIADSPKDVTIKLDQLFWSAPNYLGGESAPIYIVQKLVSGSWKLVTSTSEHRITITPADSGKSDTYRVLTSTPAGLSEPSRIAVSIGTGFPQVTVPDPKLDPDLAGSVVATQAGVGSGFVTITWTSTGAASYKIEKSNSSLDNWSSAAATTKTSRVIVLKPRIAYNLRVVDSDGNILGIIDYLGS